MHRHTRKHIPLGADNFLSILEGMEGGFAMFVGVVAGLYFQHVDRSLLVSAGIIGMIVNAFCSSSVRYMSQHYIDDLDGYEKRNKFRAYFLPALIEFVTYTVVSFIAAVPLLLITNSLLAISLTILLTVCILFAAGFYRGWLFIGRHTLHDALELSGVGLAIILVGTGVGLVVAAIVA